MRGLCYFYISILTQVSSSTYTVIGLIGHNVTLPCRYDIQTRSVLSFCWGRGMVPVSKCSNTIFSQDGAVLFRQSPRYQLLGSVADGDVSLTIVDAQSSDAGVYGCRLEIPGWFNDEKVNTRLVMEEAPVEQPVTEGWTATSGTQDTSVTKVSDPTLDGTEIATTMEKLKAVLEVENVGRVAAIFFLTLIIIIILVFVFQRRFLQKKTLTQLNSPTAENIYEVI